MSTTYPATVEGLTAALAALGDTAEAVAQTLIAGGWRGYREHCTECPTAKYVLAVVEGARNVVVNLDQVTISTAHGLAQVRPPDPVRDFIADFDDAEAEAWPGLDIEGDGTGDGDL